MKLSTLIILAVPTPLIVAAMASLLASPECLTCPPGSYTPKISVEVEREDAQSHPPSAEGNGYAHGHSTYYVFNRRYELGMPINSGWGNAVTWPQRAQADGFNVGVEPKIGAIFQHPGGHWGHVGIVEAVLPSCGVIVVSEMNFEDSWNLVTHRSIPLTQLDGFTFIY